MSLQQRHGILLLEKYESLTISWVLYGIRMIRYDTVISKFFHGVEPHRGAVFLFSESHGAIRHVFFLGGGDCIRGGSVRFSS